MVSNVFDLPYQLHNFEISSFNETRAGLFPPLVMIIPSISIFFASLLISIGSLSAAGVDNSCGDKASQSFSFNASWGIVFEFHHSFGENRI